MSNHAAQIVSILQFIVLLCSSIANAEQPPVSSCQGFFYKAKRDGVPVYKEPDRGSEVVKVLTIGEKVCYIGEQGEFVIVDWSLTPTKAPKSKNPPLSESLMYIRKAELWRTKEHGSGQTSSRSNNFIDAVINYFYYWKSGGVPEQGLVPYDPAIDAMTNSVKEPKEKQNKEQD